MALLWPRPPGWWTPQCPAPRIDGAGFTCLLKRQPSKPCSMPLWRRPHQEPRIQTSCGYLWLLHSIGACMNFLQLRKARLTNFHQHASRGWECVHLLELLLPVFVACSMAPLHVKGFIDSRIAGRPYFAQAAVSQGQTASANLFASPHGRQARREQEEHLAHSPAGKTRKPREELLGLRMLKTAPLLPCCPYASLQGASGPPRRLQLEQAQLWAELLLGELREHWPVHRILLVQSGFCFALNFMRPPHQPESLNLSPVCPYWQGFRFAWGVELNWAQRPSPRKSRNWSTLHERFSVA